MSRPTILILFFLFLLASIGIAGAESTVSLDVQPNGIIQGIITWSATADQDGYLPPLHLSFYPGNASVLVDGQPARFLLNEAETGYDLSIDGAETPLSRHDMTLSFTTADLVHLEGQQLVLSTTFPATRSSPTSLEISLPPGFVLADITNPVLPEPNTLSTTGRQIVLSWDNREEDLDLLAVFERGYTEDSMPVATYLVLVVALFASILVVVQFFRQRKDLHQTLSSNERRLLTLIPATGNGMLQKELVRSSGYSKGRVSKLLTRLEEKGFITREQGIHGMQVKKKRKI